MFMNFYKSTKNSRWCGRGSETITNFYRQDSMIPICEKEEKTSHKLIVQSLFDMMVTYERE